LFPNVLQVSSLIGVAKTVEVTQLQVGDNNRNVNIIVSTMAEAEHVADYLKDCRSNGKSINVRYCILRLLSVTSSCSGIVRPASTTVAGSTAGRSGQKARSW